jgi:hypothetical protein
LARSTVELILRRLGLGQLSALEPKVLIVRYERAAPGEMIHLDIKKLGRFRRDGTRGNRRLAGRCSGRRCAKGLRATRPQAAPNLLVVKLADVVLERGGRLVAALQACEAASPDMVEAWAMRRALLAANPHLASWRTREV